MALRVITFNCLHPIHGINWSEIPMRSTTYDETARVAATTQILRTLIGARRDGEVLVVALQEVSELQAMHLVVLNLEFNGTETRSTPSDIPKLRAPATAGYGNLPVSLSEHQMVLVFGAKATVAERGVFAEDDTNGYCALDIPERSLRVVSTHLSYGARRLSQIAMLADVAANALNTGLSTCLITGDFNCTAEAARRSWLSEIPCEIVSACTSTRIGKTGDGPMMAGETIDHFLVAGKPLAPHVVRVYETDTATISDHRPVEALFE